MLTVDARLARLDAMLADGRLVRREWTHADLEGREHASLLAALSPEVAKRDEDPEACPAEVMPAWLAILTGWINDAGTSAAWPEVIRRYAALAHRWRVLDDAGWARARVAVLLVIVREARSHSPASDTSALEAIDGVVSWLESGAPETDRARVRGAAWAAWAATTVAGATRSARTAAEAAAEEPEPLDAVEHVEEAVRLAEAAKARTLDVPASAAKAVEAAADRMIAAILDAIEAECARAGGVV